MSGTPIKNVPGKLVNANQPKDFKPKGQKAELTKRLAKRSYKAPKGKSGGDSKENSYLS